MELAGSWRSEPCTTRNHPRLLDLRLEGSFLAEDLISPCPEATRCVWSGVEVTQGSWHLEGERVLLAPDAPNGIARLAPVLEWRPSNAEEGLRDTLASQDGCHFERVRLPPQPEVQPEPADSEGPAAP